MIWLFVVVGCVLLQLLLTAILRHLKCLPKSFGKERVKLQIRENRGFLMGKCADRPKAVQSVTLLCAVFATICLLPFLFASNQSHAAKLACTLLLAGCWGNVTDRLVRGCVTDYLSFPKAFGKLKRIVFNLADLLLVFGALFAIVALFFRKDA